MRSSKKPAVIDLANAGKSSARQLHSALLEAETMRRRGHLDSAEKTCRKLLDVHPTYLGALQTFGLVALEKKNYPQAVNCFLTAAAEAPDDWSNYTNLAAAWLGLELPQMAALMLREARALNPKDAEVHFMLGEVSSDENEYEQAMQAYRAALSLNPEHDMALFRLCDCLINLGYFTEAKALLLRLRKLLPGAIAVISLMLQLPRGSLNIDFHKALDSAQKQASETESTFNNNKDFVLATILDREGAHDKAWEVLERANSDIYAEHEGFLEKLLARRAADLTSARAMTELAPPPDQDPVSLSRPTPLFILGPSRAGKTTLETLVGSHPGVKRGYENHAVEFAVKRASQSAGLISLKSLLLLPEPVHQSFASKFRNLLAANSDGATVVTNTNPGLIGSVGKLAQALPEARFVFLTRNQNDVVLRVLMKKYRKRNHHAYNLNTAHQYVEWYDEMTTVLEEKLPGRALRLRYEDMLNDTASTVASVLKLCGLEMDGLQLPEVGSDVGAAAPYSDRIMPS